MRTGSECAFRIEVGEDLLDHLGVLDAGDDPQRPATGRASLDVDTENPLEQGSVEFARIALRS